MQAVTRVGLLIGSSRNGGNGTGLAAWLSQLLEERLNAPGASRAVEVISVDPHTPPHPLGPVVDGSKLPAQVQDAAGYASPGVRAWSRFAASCAAFAVLSPEYNGGYPGELKNAIDHLYYEWAGKPIAVVAFGGHGGNKCAAQLQTVFNQVKMRVVPESVCITLPRSYITGEDRVPKDGEYPEFLGQYVEAVNEIADKLKSLLAAEPTA